MMITCIHVAINFLLPSLANSQRIHSAIRPVGVDIQATPPQETRPNCKLSGIAVVQDVTEDSLHTLLMKIAMLPIRNYVSKKSIAIN